MTAYGYCRVSTEDQGESGLGLAAQRAAVLAARPDAEVVEEVKSGGRADNRAVLRGVLARLRRGDVLVVSRLDRLTRSLKDFASIVEEAKGRGWSLVVLDGGFDMTTPTGRAMAGMLAVFAELERDMISQRTREALAAKRAGGWEPRTASLERAPECARLRDEGYSQRQIAGMMGIAREQVRRALRAC